MWKPHDEDRRQDPDVEPQPELLILINPRSGEHDVDATRETLARTFGAHGRVVRFVEVRRSSELAAVADRAAIDAAARKGVLVAVGGDGTINALARAAWRHGCALGVLPQGTFNYFGRDHGIPQDLEAAAMALLRARPQEVQVGQVNGRLFLVNASLGLYSQLLQDREAFKKELGRHRWVALVSALSTVLHWHRQLDLQLEADGERSRVRTPTLFVGNNRLQLERIGTDSAVAQCVNRGCLAALMAARPIGSWRMLILLLRGALGQLRNSDEIRGAAFRKLTVDVRGARRVKVAVDGEVERMTLPLQFEVSSRKLLLMQPREEDCVPVE